MKNDLWPKLETLIRQHPELQTSEIIPGSDVSKSKKQKDSGDWEADELRIDSRSKMPEATRREVEAEHVVEVELVPRFCNDFVADWVDSYPRTSWPQGTMDTVYVCVAW